MIVTDCSALMGFLIDPAGARAFGKAMAKADIVSAPELIDVELLSALRRLERLGAITAAKAGGIIDDFMQMPLARFSTHDLIEEIWDLRHNFSAYDASYVALAHLLKAPLLTRDAKLQRAASKLIKIVLI